MSKTIEISRELSDELAALFTKGFLDDRMVETIVGVVRKHAAPVVERQEPVAYQARHSESEPWFFTDKPGYWEWRPLFTSPPAPVVVESIAGFKIVPDSTMKPNEMRLCNCNQGRLPCTCK